METVIVAGIVAFWLLIFVSMAVVPFLSERRPHAQPARVVQLTDRRRDPKQAA